MDYDVDYYFMLIGNIVTDSGIWRCNDICLKHIEPISGLATWHSRTIGIL